MPIIKRTASSRIRGNHGILTQLAKALNVSLSNISQVNAGKRTSARVEVALKMFQKTGSVEAAANAAPAPRRKPVKREEATA